MNRTTSLPTRNLNHSTSHSFSRVFGGTFAIISAALFIAALIVLGKAIGWPAILREPASVVLPRIHANHFAMLTGYTCYLLSSLAIIPVAFALRERFIAAGINHPVVDTVTFLGAAGAVLKTLGIVRWLSAMPALAAQYASVSTEAGSALKHSTLERSTVEITYAALNGYAGSVGELLGVQLTSGLWILGTSLLLLQLLRVSLLKRSHWSLVLLVVSVGFVAGIGFLIVTARIFVPSVAAIQAFINPIGLLWLIGVGVVMLSRALTAKEG
jgi:Domain of unknown function (DUF4386)